MQQTIMLVVAFVVMIVVSWHIQRWASKRHKAPSVASIVKDQLYDARVQHLQHAKLAAYHRALADAYVEEVRRLQPLQHDEPTSGKEGV